MKDEYDFSNARRGAVASGKGKTRITIMLDEVVIEAARALAETEGYGYQTVINNILRRTLLSDLNKTTEPKTTGHLKPGITATELKSLEKKLLEALNEIHRVMEPDARP
ncbi:BrnA antitoxin family protein [Pseudomonas sp. TNT2022 ID1044]|uniref:BrnA antitoxin family protein n=1 Tax=Pseudomonas sp. TNT2022 ID1044 TaxID=2942636 RepID=UPI002361CAEE|nr:BrnA antitoxin family protein [Pseudomonas sp. TNT2022 ID1044]MDD0994452.1 BrnA antitoxin family protein [Pseudomonas sp. TNT2022 ID1044]